MMELHTAHNENLIFGVETVVVFVNMCKRMYSPSTLQNNMLHHFEGMPFFLSQMKMTFIQWWFKYKLGHN